MEMHMDRGCIINKFSDIQGNILIVVLKYNHGVIP